VPARSGVAPTIDGPARERFAIGRGERQFFRVVNASASRCFDLSFDGVPLQVVAFDGVPLDAYPGARAVRSVDHIVIAPAGRAEFVVQGPAASALLRSRCVDSGPSGDAQPASILGELVVDTSATPAPAALLSAESAAAHNVRSAAPPAPVLRRTVRLTENATHFFINGKTFDMHAMMGSPAVVSRAGTVEAWDISNDTDETHDFHIHQVHFAEEAVNGVPVADRYWMDTVDIPPRIHHLEWHHTGDGPAAGRLPRPSRARKIPVPLPHSRSRRPRHDGNDRSPLARETRDGAGLFVTAECGVGSSRDTIRRVFLKP
jgi:FtsP/CotA-like multicopper oxidase with cupredoxin domain